MNLREKKMNWRRLLDESEGEENEFANSDIYMTATATVLLLRSLTAEEPGDAAVLASLLMTFRERTAAPASA